MNLEQEKPAQVIVGNRPAADWTYAPFTDNDGGAGAARWLDRMTPEPADVYATYQNDTNVFHVWVKPGKSPVRYKYDYLLWDPAMPNKVLPQAGPRISTIPIGFGSAGGKPAFIFFSVIRG